MHCSIQLAGRKNWRFSWPSDVLGTLSEWIYLDITSFNGFSKGLLRLTRSAVRPHLGESVRKSRELRVSRCERLGFNEAGFICRALQPATEGYLNPLS